MITQDGWKLCWSDKDKNQLFDLNKDPQETRNLYYSGEFGSIIQRLERNIFEWQKRSADKLVL